jgi:hypothetical protein
MLCRVALVRTGVSEEHNASFIRVTGICKLGATLAVTSNLRSVSRLIVVASIIPSTQILVTLMKEVLSSSETSVLKRATRRKIPEDFILHIHRCENIKSYCKMLFIVRVTINKTPLNFNSVCYEVKKIYKQTNKQRNSVVFTPQAN